MTALDHLRALMSIGCPTDATDDCPYCHEFPSRGHAPDCTWVAAKKWVEIWNETDRPNAPDPVPTVTDAELLAGDSTDPRDRPQCVINNKTGKAIPPKPKPLEPVCINTTTGKIVPRGFTLIELLVVMFIILIVSVVALPTVLPALSHRQVSEGARTLQSVLSGARDAAIRDNAPRGIRLLPDPLFPIVRLASGQLNGQIDPSYPLAANRIVPIGSAPDYHEGLVTAGTDAQRATVSPLPCLMVFESILDAQGLLANPTSWFWNVRVGDKIQLNNAGPLLTVVGPVVVDQTGGNSELFVNCGAPGTQSPLSITLAGNNVVHPEYLLLVNGLDDNANGWIDEGFDGIDNDGDGSIDEATCTLWPNPPYHGEWETETWPGVTGSAASKPYTIRRRPAPLGNARETMLPSNVVIDLTTWGTTQERSRLPVNPYTGYVDVLLNPNGTAILTTIYSTPAIVGLQGAFLHFWVAERSDVTTPQGTIAPELPVPPSPLNAQPGRFNGATIAGEYRVVTLFTRTGATAQTDNVAFDWADVGHVPPYSATNPAYFAGLPFVAIQQGTR